MEKFCDNDNLIMDYILETLNPLDESMMDEHFSECLKCSNKARMFYEFKALINALKARNIVNSKHTDYHLDYAVFPAASSTRLKGASEVKTKQNIYTLRLIPFLKGYKAILEIEVSDKSLEGVLSIENEEGVLFQSDVVDGFVRNEVEISINLSWVLIRLEEKK
jgi:hypothetical protein